MTLKTNRLKKSDFEEFIKRYKPDDIKKRKATWDEKNGEGRWRSYSYDEVIAHDKTNLDIFWLKDDSLEDTENLPTPDVLAAEIVDQLEAALEEFRSVAEVLTVDD